MKNSRLILLGLGLGLCSFTLQAQDLPIPQQAETGTIGADWNTLDDTGVRYVSIKPTSTINSQNPGTPARIITYSITFPAAGSYSLYARVRVGPAGANDDSFYYGNGFGTKSPTNDNDWITVNGLNVAGFTAPTDVVTGAGTATTGVWKWINLSRLNLVNSGSESPIRFTVNANALTQTIQIGAREDGLDIDQLAFGTSNTTFTVENLNLGQAGITPPPPPPYTPTGPPLATGKSKYFGGIWSPAQLTNFTNYWNMVVPSNVGKWGSVEGTRDVFNWTSLDAAYRLAKDNGFPFRLHVLIWGNQQPTWIETLPPAEQLEEIKEWFAAVAQRYPDIDMLEVVNEPLHDPPGTPGNGGGNYVNALGGNGVTGWDWVINAFKLAREYFPNTRLMLNDYSVENSVANATSYRNIITLLQQRQLIDAIGIQGHSFSTRPTSSAVLRSSLDVLAATGLPLYITELDVNGTEDDTQLSEYQRIFPIFWEHPAVKGVSHFGWLPGADAEAYLAYSNGAERPALVWLKNYVRNTVLPCNVSTTARITNSLACKGNDGVINLTAQGGGTATYTYSWTGPNNFTATTEDLVGVAPGTYTVTVTAPSSSCSTTSSYTVGSEADTQAPSILAAGFIVGLEANGTRTIEAADIDYGSTDNCGIASMTISPRTFTCANIGPNQVTITVTDNAGNVATQTVTVLVVDNTAPMVMAAGFAVTLNNGTRTIEANDVDYGSTDNCGIASMTISPRTFTCANIGPNPVTLTVRDNAGNVTTQTVTVVVSGDASCTTARSASNNRAGSAQVAELQAYPNPATDQATLNFRTAAAGLAQVRVYNSLGRLVATIYDGPVMAGGQYQATLDSHKLVAGVYTCQLLAPGTAVTTRLIITK
ncbi:endo-1,4-beta-xylanase [Hymenobacter sp. BT186]|uniref:Endo-1,4-beta-xylanase n=1 Tax=Hymenobacter telluris TaxID=2816474 RepID=A0A939J977_9BACT|nr:endo-1,4-beta-xylanase [Hymenobacter telluris]MBO0356771.1 endo-1,4-beta-xylanase [Hymenobacter telluris]MBW3372797.1 endo-1,4-beta-xylanase [Hymenobacter norwichensis]